MACYWSHHPPRADWFMKVWELPLCTQYVERHGKITIKSPSHWFALLPHVLIPLIFTAALFAHHVDFRCYPSFPRWYALLLYLPVMLISAATLFIRHADFCCYPIYLSCWFPLLPYLPIPLISTASLFDSPADFHCYPIFPCRWKLLVLWSHLRLLSMFVLMVISPAEILLQVKSAHKCCKQFRCGNMHFLKRRGDFPVS